LCDPRAINDFDKSFREKKKKDFDKSLTNPLTKAYHAHAHAHAQSLSTKADKITAKQTPRDLDALHIHFLNQLFIYSFIFISITNYSFRYMHFEN
jgi:hypothetical protein